MISSSLSPGRFAVPAIAALLWLFVPAVVVAHAELETSTPADGATVRSPFDGPIVLEFSAALADGSRADLVGPDGAVIAEATVDGPGATMTITLDAELAPGDYEVRWVSVAEDGDLERDTFSFTVAPAPATASPSPSPSPAVASPSAVPSATAAATSSAPASLEPSVLPSPSPVEGAAGSTADVLIPIVVALLVVGAGALYLLSRRNRPMSPP